MSKSRVQKQKKYKKRRERTRIRLKHGKKVKTKKRLRLGLASKYGYRQGSAISYDQRQEMERRYGVPPLCGWIRNYGRTPTGRVTGVCSLSNGFGEENSYQRVHRCNDQLPMKNHPSCEVFQYFMRTNYSPFRIPFFIYPNAEGNYNLRFFWEGKEVAGNLTIKGKTRPKITDLGLGGFCENLQLVRGKIVEDIVPPDFQEALELRRYLSKNRSQIYEGLRTLLSNGDYHALKEQKNLVLPSISYLDADDYKLRFDWKGQEIICTVHLAGRKNKHLDKIYIDGICKKMEIDEGKIIEEIVPVRREDRRELKYFLWNPPKHIYEGLRSVLPPSAYQSLRRSDTLKSKVRYSPRAA